MKLEEIGISGSNAENVCYLRDLADATKLVNTMRTCKGGNAIVIGGGYIGMECAASLVINKINVSMVFPGSYCSKKPLPNFFLILFRFHSLYILSWVLFLLLVGLFTNTDWISVELGQGPSGGSIIFL